MYNFKIYYSSWHQGFPDFDVAYSEAHDEAHEFFIDEFPDVIEWLDENLKDRYTIDEDYEHDTYDVRCVLIIFFNDETDALAFKLRWKNELF